MVYRKKSDDLTLKGDKKEELDDAPMKVMKK